MNRLSLFAIAGLFAAVQALADSYTISGFSGEDVGSPDDYISAEFGGTLKISSTGTVENVQSGRFFIRQKFEDPFGDAPTTYQLYEGREGQYKGNLSAFSVPAGISYNQVVKSKCYTSKDASADMDVEKVYFDGKSVYAESASELYVNVNSKMTALTPAKAVTVAATAPAAVAAAAPVPAAAVAAPVPAADTAAAAPAPKAFAADSDTITAPKPVVAPALAIDDSSDEYCNEGDPDCEEDTTTYDVKGNVAATNAAADANDYSARDAANDVTNRFGIADEVRRWSAWGLVAAAAGSAVMGVVDQMQYGKAKDAQDNVKDLISKHKENISNQCGGDATCISEVTLFLSSPAADGDNSGRYLYTLNQKKSKDQDTMDSYATARNIWFGVTAVSIAGAVVLFTW